jgi:hypothetical protein
MATDDAASPAPRFMSATPFLITVRFKVLSTDVIRGGPTNGRELCISVPAPRGTTPYVAVPLIGQLPSHATAKGLN